MKQVTLIDRLSEEEKNSLRIIDEECKKTHIMSPPKLFLTTSLYDKKGELEYQSIGLSKTFNRNAYNFMTLVIGALCPNDGGSTFGAGTMLFKDTGGTTRGTSTYTMSWTTATAMTSQYTPTAGTNTFGIAVGSGTADESFDGYALTSVIAHGTGTGQLSYLAGTSSVLTYVSATKSASILHRRSFDNSGTASVTVNEIGLIYKLYVVANAYNIMVSRDLITASITVEAGQRLTVDYTFAITYPG